jgi:uncharacterized tellurite resistance protein B-like protein
MGFAMDDVELFHNLVNLAAADGKFTDEEVQFLARRAERWDISNDEFHTAMAGIGEGTVEVHLPDDRDERIQLMKEMIRLIAVDGSLHAIEKHICSLAAGKMEFSSEEFNRILQEVLDEG